MELPGKQKKKFPWNWYESLFFCYNNKRKMSVEDIMERKSRKTVYDND